MAHPRPYPNEAQTRRDLIDPQLVHAGWNVSNPNHVGIEIPVDGYDPPARQVIAARYERLRVQQREALRQAEHLFQTLLHKAFRGELSAGDGEVVEVAEIQQAATGMQDEGELVQAGLDL